MSAVDAEAQEATKQIYKARMIAQDDLIKESWVKAMEVRLVRNELEKCRKGEGANAMESCRWLAEKYAQMLQDNKLKGYKTIERT
ncbi:hypothetical protein B0H17DRAFT_1206775 [Mycena rosella]|uniref:NADH-ubiquinone oxidoreductase 12 kDa subunit n=1 Tax=Mycena rosella TaxID=1033263 RepID=A0AAD7D4L6_MYCRO|nr:hypothetical protein B0H17DRAFT_1206775 [Mycena rosella]